MKYHLALIAALISLFLPVEKQTAKPISLVTNQSESGVARESDRPHLGVKISDIAKLKIRSSKTVYRLGETVTVDVSIFSSSCVFHGR